MLKPNFEIRPVESYLDNAATTRLTPGVIEAMAPYLEDLYGNSETAYHLGRESQEAVADARCCVAWMLGVGPETVFFTSGGTESNNWAIKCAGGAGRVITCAVEHQSILESAKNAKNATVLWVDESGQMDLGQLKVELKAGGVRLVSVQYANNETGVLQPIKSISKLCREHGVLFHVDAVQAYGKSPWSVEDIGADLVSISAHKIHGPMGVGALYVKPDIQIVPLIHGGGQEGGMRSGTIPVHLLSGFGKAAEEGWSMMNSFSRVGRMKRKMESALKEQYGAIINGESVDRLPTITSVTLRGVEATMVAAVLNRRYGVCLACGPACGTHNRKSHVLEAMGVSLQDNRSTLRISLSRLTKDNHLDNFLAGMGPALKDARESSV